MGYVGRSGLTGSRFVACPFAGVGARMYRTGMWCAGLPAGSWSMWAVLMSRSRFVGIALSWGGSGRVGRAGGVAAAAVIAREDEPGDKRLVGYVTETASGSVDPGEVRRRLGQRLPGFMVPAAVVVLDALPLTVNGKVDTGALPAPEFSAPAGTGRRPPPSRRFWPGSTRRSSDSSGSGWMIRSSTLVGIRCRRCG